MNIPEGEYETVAGFILVELGRIPEAGEKITLNDSLIVITRAGRNIIEEVRLVKIES